MVVGVRASMVVAVQRRNSLFEAGTQYTAIILSGVHENRSRSRRRTTVTAVTFRSLGLTGGRGDLNGNTAVTCTATAVPRRRWGTGDYGWAAVESNVYFNYFYYCYLPTLLCIITLFWYFYFLNLYGDYNKVLL